MQTSSCDAQLATERIFGGIREILWGILPGWPDPHAGLQVSTCCGWTTERERELKSKRNFADIIYVAGIMMT